MINALALYDAEFLLESDSWAVILTHFHQEPIWIGHL